MILIREGLIAKRLYAYEDSTFETICFEVTMSKKKWRAAFSWSLCLDNHIITDCFFKELNKSLSNITRKYENILVVRDLYILILNQKKIRKITTGKTGFKKTGLMKTDASDCHKLILSFFRAYFEQMFAKTIEYRNYSKLNWTKNLTKASSTIVQKNSMICFQIIWEQF